jgi:hypothetical protein
MHKIALVYHEEIDDQYQIEMIDATKEGEYFRVASTPFFAKHLAIGDLIAVDDEDGVHYFDDLIGKSGHSTIRIIFIDETVTETTLREVRNLGAIPHFLPDTVRLVALDIPPNIEYSRIKAYLQEGMNNQLWDFEEACLGWK